MFLWGDLQRRGVFKIASSLLGATVLTLVFGYLSAFPPLAVAQETDAQPPGPTEEVIVTAPRSLRAMRAAIEEAEDFAYSMFNELNTDDDYDIICHREEPTGSRISYRNCRARFVDRLLRESTEEAFLLEVSQPLPLQEIQRHMQILQEKIEALAEQNPGFLQATIDVQLRKDEYAEKNAAEREP
jgi:hypothetical protein